MTLGRIDEWALHAYVDNELAPDQRAEVEAALAQDPELAHRVEGWRRQRDLLKMSFDGALHEPVPPRLAAGLAQGHAFGLRGLMAVAAALALLLVGGLVGWSLNTGMGRQPVATLAEEALVAHGIYAADLRHPVEVRADEKEHLQAWLSKRVGRSFAIPELGSEGYSLLGGRLVAGEGGPAALLMYENLKGGRISILLTALAEDGETAIHVEQRGPVIACSWLDGKLGFAVAGEMERGPMMKLAEAIYDQFES